MDDPRKNQPKYNVSFFQILLNIARIKARALVARLPEGIRGELYSDSMIRYDRRAGTYVDEYKKSFAKDWIENVVMDGRVTRAPYGDALQAHLNWLGSDVIRPMNVANSSILEVGAGELTTLVPLVKAIGEKTLKAYACELTWSRCSVGEEFAKAQGIKIESIVAGSVTDLPYPDNRFDIVYTHYCLEELGGLELKAIGELVRVAKRYVILVEASYEFGHPLQRRKLRARRWNLGLVSAIKALKLKLVRHELVPYCTDDLHHGAIFVIEKQEAGTLAADDFVVACPKCKGPIKSKGSFYACKPCGLAFPILEGIPVLTPGNAIVASKFSKRIDEP